jgi:Zn-dependent peptidase ImmA (M78 family)/DNA-binding XRE family transcriptional regulator
MIGDRVAHARSYYGWTQTQLAKLIGVSQPAISQIERTGQVSDLTLAAIADATQFAPWWFRLGPMPDLPEGTLRYRKLAGATQRDDERVRAYVLQSLEVIDRLSQDAHLPAVRLLTAPRSSITNEEAIEDWASEARDWLGVGRQDPIPNLTRAVERAGVMVFGFADELEKHDAVSFWPDFPEGRPLICFSRGYPGDRQRFSVAHELGHLTLHHWGKPQGRDAEAEANRFASALLIPRDAALKEIQPPVTLSSLAYVKARWGLSIASLIVRAVDLHIVSEDKKKSLFKQLSARRWRKNEPVFVPEEKPVLMQKLIAATVGPGSPREVAVTLGLPPMASRELMA